MCSLALCCVHFYVFYCLVLFYFITFTPKCFALAVAAVSAELTAIMRNKACKFYAHDTLAGNSRGETRASNPALETRKCDMLFSTGFYLARESSVI